MTDSIALRRSVRMVLSARPRNRRLSEELIFEKLKNGAFPDLRTDELQIALHWNHSKGFIDYVRNGDDETNDWGLTTEGWHKEGLA
jgi:hypothetical protein